MPKKKKRKTRSEASQEFAKARRKAQKKGPPVPESGAPHFRPAGRPTEKEIAIAKRRGAKTTLLD